MSENVDTRIKLVMALRMVNDRKIYDAPEYVYCINTGEFIWFPKCSTPLSIQTNTITTTNMREIEKKNALNRMSRHKKNRTHE